MRIEEEGNTFEEADKKLVNECIAKAMRYLQYSDRTEFQLRKKLKEGGFPPSAVNEAVLYIKSFHYIDDRRYAESYTRVNRDKKSRRELSEALRTRGIDREIIGEVLDDSSQDDEESAVNILLKKYGPGGVTDQKQREKAIRYLSSRGFSYSAIRKALDRAGDSSSEEF